MSSIVWASGPDANIEEPLQQRQEQGWSEEIPPTAKAMNWKLNQIDGGIVDANVSPALGGDTGTSWAGRLYAERDPATAPATPYPEVRYDLSPGLGGWVPWRERNPDVIIESTTSDLALRQSSTSGAQTQVWRRKLPEMPHFSRSVSMSLRDVAVDVAFGPGTTSADSVTARLRRPPTTLGSSVIVAESTQVGIASGNQQILLVNAGHDVVSAYGTDYVLEVVLSFSTASLGRYIIIMGASMLLAKDGVE